MSARSPASRRSAGIGPRPGSGRAAAALVLLLAFPAAGAPAAGKKAPASAAVPAGPKPRDIVLTTSDGWKIKARYRRAGKGGAVVLLHGLAAGKGEWAPLVDALAERGVSTLALDLRGHDPDDAARSWRTFTDHGASGQWASMWKDAEAGVKALRARGHESVAVAGASLGANVALEAAVRLKDLKYAVLLSPGLDYQGVRTEENLPLYGARPLLLAVRDAMICSATPGCSTSTSCKLCPSAVSTALISWSATLILSVKEPSTPSEPLRIACVPAPKPS